MKTGSDLLMDLNILARTTQKYYDHQLQGLDLNYGQLPILLMIYEQQGLTLNAIVTQGMYDKGTVTKNVQKLKEQGYITVQESREDRRAKLLYPTDKAKEIISRIYGIRRRWSTQLVQQIPENVRTSFLAQTGSMVNQAVKVSENQDLPIYFFKAEPLNASLWPGHLSYVLHSYGCNLNCPDCPDKRRLILQEDTRLLDPREILADLKSRARLMDSLVLTGGEPLLQSGLAAFLCQVKALGYQVRLETNGTRPEALANLLKENLVDSVSLLIKNHPEKYAASCGRQTIDISLIHHSICLLEEHHIPWQGRLVLNDTYFEPEDLPQLRQALKNIPDLIVENYAGSGKAQPMEETMFAQWKKELQCPIS